MFRINRLKLEIKETSDLSKVYGFDIPFHEGLNIIAGENSKGKTTVSSCIYYALGMEELLGGQNDKALGKALKSEFRYSDRGEKLKLYVYSSKVFIEIVNSQGKICTLKRTIKYGGLSDRDNNAKTKYINVYEARLDELSNAEKKYPLFLRNNQNNEDDYGFYYWLADFIGIELPYVTNINRDESPLYLQTIFSALFIEQTKGWSGYLATLPFFGIQNNKEKVVSFLLNLKELYKDSEIDRIEKDEKLLKEKWEKIYNTIEILADENKVENTLPVSITFDKRDFEGRGLYINHDSEYNLVPLETAISAIELEISQIKSTPIKRIGDVKDSLRIKLEDLYKTKDEFNKNFDEFDLKLRVQERQKESIEVELSFLEKELMKNKGINNVIDEAIIEDVYDHCPKCNQKVSKDLISEKNIEIETLTLTENISYLTGQIKIIKSSFNSLNKVINEKRKMRKYYLKKQKELEEEIKLSLRELISDDRDYSQTETLKFVRIEKKLSDLKLLNERYSENLDLLIELADQYKSLIEEREKIKVENEVDKVTLDNFEDVFKKLLFRFFKYDSNSADNIFIQREQPFKFFPVFKYKSDDKFPQLLKTNSSASDFVRSIWAYSVALLVAGSNHPGLIIFDEPGQHRVKSDSLKNLFYVVSKLKAKLKKGTQSIIFTSVEKTLSENEDENDKLDLKEILGQLSPDDYSVWYIKEGRRSIDLMTE